MTDLLVGQLDYVYFAHGLAFVLAASLGRTLAWRSNDRFAWRWFAAFALGAGLSGWVEVFAAAFGASPLQQVLRIVLVLAACVALLQFCRSSDTRRPIAARWLLLPLAIAAAAGLAGGMAGAETGCRYALILPSTAWAASLFLRRARHDPADRRLALPGLGLLLLALASGVLAPASGAMPVSAGGFVAATGLPFQYLRMVAAVLLALGLWRYYSDTQRADERVVTSSAWTRYVRGLTVSLVVVLAGGWLFTQWTAAEERAEWRAALHTRAATVRAMLPGPALGRLSGTPADAASDSYQETVALLQAACDASPDVLSVAIVGRRRDGFVYLAEAISGARRKSGDRAAGPGAVFLQSPEAATDLLLRAATSGNGDVPHDDDQALSSLVPVRLAATQAPGVLVLRVDPAERRQVVARARFTPILLTLVTSLLFVAYFISERKMAESTASMAASERRYRGLVEGSPNGITLLDASGCCLAINRNGLRTFAVGEEQVVGRRLADLWPEDERPRVEALHDQVSQGGRATLDTRYRTPGGDVFDLELVLNPVTDGAGRVTHQVGIVLDVTERLRALAALERSHRFTQVILGISTRILNLRAERVDAATREALREVAVFLGVDRAQLFHLSPDRATFSLTHEWCSPGLDSRLSALQSVPVDDFPWLWSSLEATGFALAADVESMPPAAAAEQSLMRGLGVSAFACVPVRRRGQVTGFLALDAFGHRREWPNDEVALLGIVADVLSNGLARKLADEALRESEQRFQRAFRNNPAAMAIVWTENERLVEVNEAFLALVDRRLEEVVGRTVSELELIEGERERQRFTAAVLSGEQLRHMELRIRTGTGDVRHLSLSMDAFELAGQRFMLTVALDLSARVHAEETLRDREEVFRSISAAAQDGIIMIDSAGRVTVWNEAAERMFGYEREEAEGQPIHALILPDDDEAPFLEGFAHFRSSGQGRFIGSPQQVLGRRRDGSHIPVELSASAVNLRGQWHAVGILRDITERLKVDEALWRAKEETESANAELQRSVERANQLADEAALANAYKSEFLANMSHEIRTPMNGIIGMTGLLLDTELNPDQFEYADTVRHCADSLLTIINDILDFSKIEAGKLDLETLDFDLADVIDGTLDVFAVRAHQKGLELACLVGPSVPTALRGDPGRVRQILTNLVGNAIKFTERGEVTLDAEVESADASHTVLRFSVRDTGIGIPPDKATTLFQPFTQVDASTTRRFGGTGLGLSISRRLAEMMGGAIGVESIEGVGSRFWFTARLERQPGQVEDASAVDLTGLRVLGQDVNPTSGRALAAMLESWGCRHTIVSWGADALSCLTEGEDSSDPYDVAILDMDGSGITGLELGRRIAADPMLAATALLLTTTAGQRGEALRTRDAGFSAVLAKPVKPRHLRKLLVTLSGRDGRASAGGAVRAVGAAVDAPGRKHRLLLAEDNITNQKVATKVLERMGHRVDTVANGREALEALRTIPYDLVFMDVQMPEMDGLEATRRIRDPKTGVRNPAIPIVAMTAHAMKGDRERCLAAGMDDYVSKPITPQDVAAAIARRLPAGSDGAVPQPALVSEPAPDAAAAEPESSDAGLPDRSSLLARLGGEEDVFVEVIKIFLEDVPHQLTGIDESLAAGDAKTLRRLAHTLKGSSGTAGAVALQNASQRLEQAAASGDMEAAAALVAPVKDLFTQVLSIMSGWVGESAS